MARVLHITAGAPQATSPINSTLFFALAAGANLDAPSTQEALRHMLYRSPGKISKLYVRVIANTLTATSTLSVRNNGADTAMTVNIPATTTGVFEDTTNEVTVAAGDKLNYKFVPGDATNTLTISILSVVFQADTNTITRVASGNVTGFTNDSVSRYNQLTGLPSVTVGGAGTEATAKTRIRKACTAKNLSVNISANSRTTTSMVRMRKNGANGNMSITVAAGVTGWLEDTTNTDTLAAGNDYNSVVETLTGGGSLSIRSIGCELESTTSESHLITAASGGQVQQAANTTNYFAISGFLVVGTTEADRKVKANESFTLSELTIFVSANTVTASSTLKLRKNGADTALTLTIPSSTTGVISNSSNTVTVTDTDEINLVLTTGATGTSMTVRNVSINALGRDIHFARTLSETDTIGESRARQKAIWRLQP